MLRLAITILVAAMLTLGCSSEKSDSTPQSQATPQAGRNAPETADQYPTDLQMNPSGVRYQEMTIGTGKTVTQGMYVVFDYSCWGADATGLRKMSGIGSSVGRPGQAYQCQVGVHPLPGLSDGLIGMKIGGSRRIFVPWQLGFPDDGGPFARNNLIYEAIEIKEATPEAVAHFQDSLTRRLELVRRIQDSLQHIAIDSLEAMGLDTSGQPVGPIRVPE